MKVLLLGFTIAAMAHAASYSLNLDMENIINKVNSAQASWTAGHNFAPDTPHHFFKRLMGVKKTSNGPALPKVTYSGVELPANFDARKQWPDCPTISHVLDQGDCGSCWAVGAASAMSDRKCIASNGTSKAPLSAEQMLSCCDSCGDGCDGGDPDEAWQYFVDTGLVTGGDYKSGVGCQPYALESCEHHVKGPKPQCSKLPTPDTPNCEKKCTNDKYKTPFKKDLKKAKTAYSLSTVKAAQEDILKYGSIEAAFNVYADFLAYKSGVYHHVTGDVLGGHAVRVIGWGTENGTPYWLVANSWNNAWGDKGLFKIRRGTNECGFEDDLVAGRI